MSQLVSSSKPVSGVYTVRQDGAVYRWFCHRNPCGILSSKEAFLTLTAAEDAGRVVAECNGGIFQPSSKRIIAVGRSVNGQPFRVVAPPVDFADAVDAVMNHYQMQGVRLSDEALAQIEAEDIGAELCTTPFQW